MRAIMVLSLLLSLSSSTLEAQSSPAPLRYGKWVLLAGSVGLNLAAASAHRDAEAVFDQLQERCAADNTLCDVDGAGAYVDATSEALYQETLQLDSRTRSLLLGGEAALLGAAVLFVWEFARPKAPPDNIPFAPKVSFHRRTTDLGIQLAW